MAAAGWSAEPLGLRGQVAMVTGGARGIGFAAASALAHRGASVCLVDLDPKPLEAAADALRTQLNAASASALASAAASTSKSTASVAEVMVFAGDVRDERCCEAAVAAAVRRWGRVDVLVQAAGITGKVNVKTAEVDPRDFEGVVGVNLRGIFLMCRAVLPVMAGQKYGRIVNIASIAGKEGNAGMLAYSTSKAGVIGLTKVVGKEYAESGITCNALCPAVVRTEMVAAMPEAQVKYMTDKIPMKRTGELHEIADLICFIASPSCSFTTGFCFDASGGRATY